MTEWQAVERQRRPPAPAAVQRDTSFRGDERTTMRPDVAAGAGGGVCPDEALGFEGDGIAPSSGTVGGAADA